MRQGNPGTQPHTHSTHPCLWLWPHGGGGSCHLMSFRPPSLAVVTTQSDPVCPGTSACAAQCLWDREALWPSAGGGASVPQPDSRHHRWQGLGGLLPFHSGLPATGLCSPQVSALSTHFPEKETETPEAPPGEAAQTAQPNLWAADLSARSPGWKPPQGRYALGVSRRAARSSGEKESPAGTPNPPAPGR